MSTLSTSDNPIQPTLQWPLFTIDIGNTAIKVMAFASVHSASSLRHATFTHHNETQCFSDLLEFIMNGEASSAAGETTRLIVMASVVPMLAEELASFLSAWLPAETTLIQAVDKSLLTRNDMGVDFSCYTQGQLGFDRAIGLLGGLQWVEDHPDAFEFSELNAIMVADFGTAFTMDVMTVSFDDSDLSHRLADATPALKGVYQGGSISPGLQLYSRVLSEHTAALFPVDIKDVPKANRTQMPALGQNTKDALLAGVRHGYEGVIQNLLHESLASYIPDNADDEQLERMFYLVATGGDADLLRSAMDETFPFEVQPHLLHYGLKRYAFKFVTDTSVKNAVSS